MNFQFSIFNFQFLVIFLLILGLVLPSFSLAQEQPPQAPETLEEAKSFGLQIIGRLPDAVKEVWREEALPIWQRMWEKAQGPWNNYIKPKIDAWWGKFLSFAGKEVEKRKPTIEEEFQKEKEEMKKDIQNSLWERFKELLK